MSSNFQKTIEFHDTFSKTRYDNRQAMIDHRMALISEEVEETREALDNLKQDPTSKELQAEALKELIDILYVTYGSIQCLGWDADKAFEAVHKSNMSKVDDNGEPIYREDGKVLKGPNYQPPNMKELLDAA